MAIRFYDYVAYNAKRYPEKRALLDLETLRSVTYQQLDRNVSRLARYLRAEHHIQRNDRVAILAHNSIAYLELLFACGRLGCVLVPLNWRLTSGELAVILTDSAPSLLLHDQSLFDVANQLRERKIPVCDLVLDSTAYLSVLSEGSDFDDNAMLYHDDTQIIMYTSGTTGTPKGALLTYGMSFWNAVNLGIPSGISPATCALCVMPMFHTAGLNVYALPTLHAGGSVLLMRSFDAGRVLDTIDDAALGVTHFFGVPSAWQFMAQHPSFNKTNFQSILLAGAGGAPVPVSLLELWQTRGVYIQNGFGMTETSPSVTTLASQDAIRKIGSIGMPLLHTEVKLMKDENTEAASEEVGEIWVRGPNVTPGYWRNPAANATAFHEGWLRSGDLGMRDRDGYLYILDRIKDMYISGGENVYPAEVENILLKLEGVANAAVIGIEDARWGETGKAFICVHPGARVSEEMVRDHCTVSLARFKHPREIVFLKSLPLTGSGKVHKPTLRQL